MVEVIFLVCVCSALVFSAVVFSEDVQAAASAIPVVTTAETLAAVSMNLTLPSGSGKALISGRVTLTIGAGTTGVTLTIYRGAVIGGSIVGAQVNQTGNFTPGGTATFDVEYVDPLNNVGGAQYCLSVKQIGATGNGSIVNALIHTTVLSG
jgi:hypothetical protein